VVKRKFLEQSLGTDNYAKVYYCNDNNSMS